MPNDKVERAKQIDLRAVIPLVDERTYGQYKAGLCPFHEANGRGHTPSFLVYPDHYVCLGARCEAHGDIFNWFAYKMFGDPNTSLRGSRFVTVLTAIIGESKKPQYKLAIKEPVKEVPKTPAAELLRLTLLFHEQLMKNPKRINYFLQRGFTLETVIYQMWGWDGRRYVLPVWTGKPKETNVITLRFRSSDSKDIRYSGIKGSNDHVLYNAEALEKAIKEDLPLFIFYGEFDAQLAWQDGYAAVSPTNGALSFNAEWVSSHKGHKIFVPDKGEEKAALRDAEVFSGYGWVAHLPPGKFKDYTEMRQRHGNKAKEVLRKLALDLGVKV